MKQVWIAIVISTISLLLLLQAAIILVIFMPGIFYPIAEKYIQFDESEDIRTGSAEFSTAHPDSLHAFVGDSTYTTEPVWEDTVAAREMTITALYDTIGNYRGLLNREGNRISMLENQIQSLQTRIDEQASKERQNMARLLESMPPEDAVRILRTTTDKEVRETLLLVNRRQAARIMTLLEPDRAARIMEFTLDDTDRN